MNVALAMLLSLGLLLLAYRLYARVVSRWLGVEPERPTPAVRVNDGQDYVPTQPLVLFGHHFASIAAAGPIVGPTLAAFYGFLPAWLWLMLGVIFLGAVHDLTALVMSVRQGGKSVAEVARATLGPAGFLLYVLFAILLCVLVGAAFLNIAVEALTSHYRLADLKLAAGQTLFRTLQVKGQAHALTGGIATVSVIVVTLAAPLMGWLLYRRGISAWKGSLLATAICAASVWVGFRWQLVLDPTTVLFSLGDVPITPARAVLLVLLFYCFLAAWLPVWLVLQPRDFVNVHLLYFGLGCMVVGLVACGLQGTRIDLPASNVPAAEARLGDLWPFLFVTIACGACSGAHGLVCGGTTCKQLASERHAPAIGYGAMLLESLLGVCVLLMIAGPLGWGAYQSVVWPKTGGAFAVQGFALAVGQTMHVGFGLPVHAGTIFGILLLEGFVLTTVDTLVRLARYLFEELWETLFRGAGARPPAWLASRHTNTALPIAIIAWLAFSNSYLAIWPVFGTANQLLAALTLIAATVWLLRRSRPVWFVALPALFMAATTITSLVLLLRKHHALGAKARALFLADSVLFALAAGVVALAAWQALRYLGGKAAPEEPAA